MESPYNELLQSEWEVRTRLLIQQHPLKPDEIYQVVHKVWQDIFLSSIGTRPYKLGIDIFPSPQIMGFLLHEIIALEFSSRYPGLWRRDSNSSEKDLVYMPDDLYSIEIKTLSSPKSIFGNRSYAQPLTKDGKSKKAKSGYYLAVNFEKISNKIEQPKILQVRFGWLDHADWMGQSAATGQQAKLSPAIEKFKLLKLPLTE